MADSLRDQLLKSGIVRQARNNKPACRKEAKRKPDRVERTSSEVDLAHAWAMRSRAETQERRRSKADAEAKARARKERLRKLQECLHGKVLNKAEAEHVRHFEYCEKIRRVHVDGEQLAALNQGLLGVVWFKGRSVLVTRDVADRIQAFAPEDVALLADPNADAPDDGVPDDLIW